MAVQPMRYLRGLRRRWHIVLTLVFVGAAVGWVTTSTVAPVRGGTKLYSATALLVDTSTGSSTRTTASGDLLALYVTLRSNAEAVAKELQYKGDPISLALHVQATTDPKTGVLGIQAADPDPRQAEKVANAFADQLLVYLADLRNQDLTAQVKALQSELKDAHGSSTQKPANGSRGTAPGPAATNPNETIIQQQISSLKSQIKSPVSLAVIQRAVASPIQPSGIQAPNTRAGRTGIGAIAGLFLGIVLAFVLERLDTKLRTKDGAEDRFGVPVLAQIPRFPRSERRRIVAAARPTSPAADAFRLLAAGISRSGQPPGSSNGDRSLPHVGPIVVFVTSAGPAEGKTTIAANLAAIYAEIGRRVVVLSCDTRRPRIHRVFGVEDGPGLAEALAQQGEGVSIEARLVATSVPNVRLMTTGAVTSQTAGLVGSDRMRALLNELRQLADVVIVDTAPILVSSETAPVVADVDVVLIVAEAGRTSGDLAERTAELLDRLGAAVAGVALNKASDVSVPRGYYRYYQVATVARAADSEIQEDLLNHNGQAPDVETVRVSGERDDDRGEG
jgi:capsular exopolysaccharide synthesis family protein